MTLSASVTELPAADGSGAVAIVRGEVKIIEYCSLKDSIISSNRSSAEEDKIAEGQIQGDL